MNQKLIIAVSHKCCGSVFHGAAIPVSFADDEFMEELKMYANNPDKYIIDIVTKEDFKFSTNECSVCEEVIKT